MSAVHFTYTDHEQPCDCFRRWALDTCPCGCHLLADDDTKGHR